LQARYDSNFEIPDTIHRRNGHSIRAGPEQKGPHVFNNFAGLRNCQIPDFKIEIVSTLHGLHLCGGPQTIPLRIRVKKKTCFFATTWNLNRWANLPAHPRYRRTVPRPTFPPQAHHLKLNSARDPVHLIARRPPPPWNVLKSEFRSLQRCRGAGRGGGGKGVE